MAEAALKRANDGSKRGPSPRSLESVSCRDDHDERDGDADSELTGSVQRCRHFMDDPILGACLSAVALYSFCGIFPRCDIPEQGEPLAAAKSPLHRALFRCRHAMAVGLYPLVHRRSLRLLPGKRVRVC